MSSATTTDANDPSATTSTPPSTPAPYTPSSSIPHSVQGSTDVTQYTDTPEEIAGKVKILAELFRTSSCGVGFTGAGISHSSGILTYRGPDGMWTRRAQGLPPPEGV